MRSWMLAATEDEAAAGFSEVRGPDGGARCAEVAGAGGATGADGGGARPWERATRRAYASSPVRSAGTTCTGAGTNGGSGAAGVGAEPCSLYEAGGAKPPGQKRRMWRG